MKSHTPCQHYHHSRPSRKNTAISNYSFVCYILIMTNTVTAISWPLLCSLLRYLLLLLLMLYLNYFWATVCKTVHPMLSEFVCLVLSVLYCLSVTLVYCGQTVEWIKMKLGMRVGLRPGHTVLDGDPAPPNRKSPQFSAISVVAKWLDGSRCHLVRR